MPVVWAPASWNPPQVLWYSYTGTWTGTSKWTTHGFYIGPLLVLPPADIQQITQWHTAPITVLVWVANLNLTIMSHLQPGGHLEEITCSPANQSWHFSFQTNVKSQEEKKPLWERIRVANKDSADHRMSRNTLSSLVGIAKNQVNRWSRGAP